SANEIKGDFPLITNQNHKSESSSSLRSEGKKEESEEERFFEFKKAYPKRKGSMGWHEARKRLKRACAETPFETILGAAREYAAEMRAGGKLETEYVKMPATWLNQRCYADYGESPCRFRQRPREDHPGTPSLRRAARNVLDRRVTNFLG